MDRITHNKRPTTGRQGLLNKKYDIVENPNTKLASHFANVLNEIGIKIDSKTQIYLVDVLGSISTSPT